MKLITTVIFAGMLAFGTAACAKEESKKVIPVVASAATAPVNANKNEGPGKGEIKEVCVDKTDRAGKIILNKDGKPVQECKKIKVRKKLEGTEIPPSKK